MRQNKYILKKKINKLLVNYPSKIMLNIGCGTDYKKGWINIDNNSDNNIKNLDLNWDLRYPLPFADNSVDYIFNEHFIEHLTIKESQTMIKDLMRILKPGGVMRIATPDLAMTVDKYLNMEIKDDPVVKKYHMEFIKTRAERINIAFRWWGHQWLYDWEELKRRLQQAGLKKIVKCEHGKSKHAALNSLETRPESNLIVEVVK